MQTWLLAAGVLLGVALLYICGDLVVENLILLARYVGVSIFYVGFIVSSIGSDIPEIVSGVYSAILGHGDIAVGNSIGSANSQLLLLLGLIPFMCTFCRLIPRPFAIVGATEAGILAVAVALSFDGVVSTLDGLLLISLWVFAIWVIRRFGGERYAVEESAVYKIDSLDKPWTALNLALGFVGIGLGSYLVVESVIAISENLGVSEFFISFFALSIGTSLPEFVVVISSIRKRYYELAIGDIIGSCIVDLTLALGIATLFAPLIVDVNEIRLIGVYSILLHIAGIGLLSHRGVNDRRSGAFLLSLYVSTWLLLLFY